MVNPEADEWPIASEIPTGASLVEWRLDRQLRRLCRTGFVLVWRKPSGARCSLCLGKAARLSLSRTPCQRYRVPRLSYSDCRQAKDINMSTTIDKILQKLAACDSRTRRDVFDRLRSEFPIHPLETTLKMSAEQLLHSLDRAIKATPMLVGILAETAFEDYVIKTHLTSWKYEVSSPRLPHDFLLKKGRASVSVQVKLQRSKNNKPVKGSPRATRWKIDSNMFKVEMHRTRGGTRSKDAEGSDTGKKTRPYRYGGFDILAVSMFPETGDWRRFVYTVGAWLIPDPDNSENIAEFQPVSLEPNDDWTPHFETCVRWLKAAKPKTIKGGTFLPKTKKGDAGEPGS